MKVKDDTWTKSRCNELALLRETLCLAGSLDKCNCIVGHIQELEKNCRKLTDTAQVFSTEIWRDHFIRFLENQARFAWKHRKELKKLIDADKAEEQRKWEEQAAALAARTKSTPKRRKKAQDGED